MRKPLLLAATFVGAVNSARAEGSQDGAALYQQNCASCHGGALEGQPDWRGPGPDGLLPAPPHDATGHTWHHGDNILFRITRDGTAAVVGGGYESNIPGFGDVLTDTQIRTILDYIKSTWPDRERAYQKEITAQE
ncbi:Cytochrome c, mono- and diheme variant [Phaeobacter piscinae]|uniref:Cytochrome c, mono-and diheme variant n=1 Tax=Phaeobacter piscinae TaxID=1580596 RepID=A0ABN5DFR6_9RHOB|nr:c-type cytochrome [Phaeobacter piscinae]ATG35871.1 Cytochrome c, mono- and diheme variant [Phaeobacter piscinae]AUQ86392.1 Cytochrome c, mono- and diheme variant [Phaeobacter piscinae]AUR24275.1 Cytochrome c, mono- and diheme variant [Phaeobacter piscinae]